MPGLALREIAPEQQDACAGRKRGSPLTEDLASASLQGREVQGAVTQQQFAGCAVRDDL